MKTVILIPGLVSDARVWRALRTALTGWVFVVDGDITAFADIPDMAKALLEKADGELIAVGHSLGGRVAMEMARQSPERVRALVLANTGHSPRWPGEELKRQAMIDLGHRSMAGLAAQWLATMVGPERVGDSALMADLTDMVLKAGPEVHERQIRALLRRPDAAAHMGDYRGPTLLITGAQDAWSPVQQHREIQRMCNDAELKIIADAGHFMPIEQPVTTAETIMEWLQRRQLL